MACPFFMPTKEFDDGGWLHPARLPLGRGWSGKCCAPGHEGYEPTEAELREFCNLGYAAACPYLPAERAYDAVRFSVTNDGGQQITLCFVCEFRHRPALHGILEYDAALNRWPSRHPEARIQKMAECYLQSYLLRRVPADHSLAGTHP